MTKHRNALQVAVLIARNKAESRQTTLHGSVTIGPRFTTDVVKWVLLKYQASSTAVVSNVLLLWKWVGVFVPTPCVQQYSSSFFVQFVHIAIRRLYSLFPM